MTNETDYEPIKYTGNGVTTEFSFNFKAMSEDSITVILEDAETSEQTTQTLNVYYTLELETATGGTVTMLTAPKSGYYLIISRDTSRYQSASYSTSVGFQATEIEKSYDKVSCALQEQDECLYLREFCF